MSDPNKSIIALGAVKLCVLPLAAQTHFSVAQISPTSSQKDRLRARSTYLNPEEF